MSSLNPGQQEAPIRLWEGLQQMGGFDHNRIGQCKGQDWLGMGGVQLVAET